MTIVGDKKRFLTAVVTDSGYSGVTKRHRFGGGCGFIEQRGVSDIEPCQIRYHRLKVQQRF